MQLLSPRDINQKFDLIVLASLYKIDLENETETMLKRLKKGLRITSLSFKAPLVFLKA